MKVTLSPSAKSGYGWFDPSEVLIVLAANSVPSGGSRFLLWSEKQSTAALFPVSDFEIMDNRLPSAWVAKVDLNGYLELAPPEWLSADFWERFHNGDPEAEATFKKEVAAIKCEAMNATNPDHNGAVT